MTALVKYVLAVASARYGVQLVSAVVMSNHMHLVVHDVEGRLPDFNQYVFSLIARAMNVELERTDRFWEGCPVNVVELGDSETVLDRAAYVMANPTAAGLVATGSEWIGFRSDWRSYEAERVRRPAMRFFTGRTTMPLEATLRFVAPPEVGMTGAEFGREVQARAEAKEAAVRAVRKDFVGAEALRRMRWDRPVEARGGRRAMVPRFAARSEATREALKTRRAEFLREYEAARMRFVAGEREVLFPYGTYKVAVRWGARVRPPP